MPKYIAICTSIQCNKREVNHVATAARKDVSINTIDCPDCGSALFWTEENRKSHHLTASSAIRVNRHKKYGSFRFKI